MPGELDLGSLVMRIRADATGVLEGARQLEAAMNQMRTGSDKAGAAIEKSSAQEVKAVQGAENATAQAAKGVTQSHQQMGKSAEEASAMQAAAYAGIAATATKMIDIVIGAVEKGIDAHNRYIASMQGVQSVAQGRGIGGEAMQAALDGLTDSFFDTTAAATALKNLLSRGYTLDQAVSAINAFKNSAAFGRQASLSLAQAVVSATEGIKNENSILVDNAGVTKNVAKMWEDYAKARGIATTSLTTAQKIEAEYQGIMQETRFQMGDLQKLTSTLAGTQAEAAMSGELLSRSYGSSMAPVVGLMTEGFTTFQNILRGTVDTFPGLTAGLTAGGVALLALTVIVPAGAIALEQLKISFAGAAKSATIFGVSVKAAMPWFIGITAAIGVVTWAYTAYAKGQEEAAKAAAEAAQAEKERLQGLRDEVSELTSLDTRYRELTSKKKLSYSETKELYQIEQTLEGQYKITVSSLDGVASAYGTVTQAIKDKIAANEVELQKQRELDSSNAKVAATSAQSDAEAAEKAYQQLSQTKSDYLAEMEQLDQRIAKLNAMGDSRADTLIKEAETRKAVIQTYLSDIDAKFKNEIIIMERSKEAWKNYIDSTISMMSGTDVSATESFAQSLAKKIWDDKSAQGFASTAEAQAFANQLVTGFSDAIDNADISTAKEAVDKYYQKVLSGEKLSDTELADFQGFFSQLVEGAGKIGEAYGLSADKSREYLLSMYNDLDMYNGSVKDLQAAIQAFDPAKFLAAFRAGDTEGMTKATEDAKRQTQAFSDLSASLADSRNAIKALQTMQSEWGDQTSQKYKDAKDAAEEYFGREIIGLNDMKFLLTEEGGLRDNLLTQYYAQRDALSDSIIQLSQMRNALRDAFGEGSVEAAALDTVITEMMRKLRDGMYQVDLSGSTIVSAMSGAFNMATASVGQLQAELDKATKEAEGLGKALDQKKALYDTISNVKKIADAQKNNKASAEDWAKAQKDAAEALGYTGTNAEEMASKASLAMSNVAAETADLQTKAQNSMGWIQSLLSYIAGSSASVNINTSSAQSALGGLISVYNAMANSFLGRLLGWKPIGAKSGGGGGGGNSPYSADIAAMEHEVGMERMSLEQQLAQLEALDAKYRNRRGVSTLKLDDQRDLEKRIFDVQEEIRKKNLEDAYDALDHKKTLGQLTLQAEIDWLEQIKAAHQLNADELADIDERLYDTREALRQQQYQADMDLLNHKKAMGELTVQQELDMLQGIINSHQLAQDELWSIQEQMYALQQQRQQEALDTQTNAIQKAYNKITAALKARLQDEKDAELAALDDRIKMLQDQTEAENEAARVQDYEENLAEKQRQLRITKSARERRELQAEIDKMIADEQRRQEQLARQAEIDALKDQKTAVNDKYTQLMNEENLRQEALRMVMSNNLQQMTDLIASFGTPWEDAGASLVQYLTTGITSGKSTIIGALENLSNGMQEAVQRQLAMIGQSIPNVSGGGGMIVNFYNTQIGSQQDADYVLDELDRRIARARN